MSLLKTRRFLPLLVTQFLGAFNDNLFKNALLTLVALKMSAQSAVLSNVIAGLFILPFFIFSATAGEVADKYPRNKIARVLKVTEVLLMLGVALAWCYQSLWILIAVLTLMGTQSAFFGPVKYSLLPQHLEAKELIAGNAYIESTTYLAILLGLILGTLLPINVSIMVLIICAICGCFSAYFIPLAKAPRGNLKIGKNIFRTTVQNLSFLRKHSLLFRCVLGATWFWIIGALVAVQVYPLCAQIINSTEGVITWFLVLFSLGVAAGSYVCNKILKGFIQATYVPLGAVGMAVCLFLLYFYSSNYPTPLTQVGFFAFFNTPHALGLSLCLFMLAFFGGIYIIPLNAMMQHYAPKAYVASVIAGNNIMNALGMALIAIFAAIFLALGFGLPNLFLVMAILSAVEAFAVCSLLPDALTRSLLQGVLYFLFSSKVKGLGNFRKAGKRVLIVANHVSLLDGVLIAAFMPERITFAVNTEWAHKWFMPVVRLLADFYPIDSRNPLSVRSLIEELKKDKKIMIFPEGRITITGSMMKIYEGAGIIAQKSGAKILPVRIDGAQYSKFSYLKKKIRTTFFPKISLNILPPEQFAVDENVSRRQYRKAVSQKLYDIMAHMIYQTSAINENIFKSLSDMAAVLGKNHIIAEDINRKPQSFKSFIIKSHVLGSYFGRVLEQEERIGLMLPNVLANLVSFFALQAIDKVPAMLNFTLGVSPFVAALKGVEIKTIISSRDFIEKAKLEKLEKAILESGIRLIYLEDLAHDLKLSDKLCGLKNYYFKKMPQKKADKTAVVLFTSGSEGTPKAVFLSHRNLQANRYQIASVIPFGANDIVFNALPMFHSFGLSVGTLLPLLFGVKVFLYPSPLHYRIVPELCYDTAATVIFGTDTFFAGYGKMANPYDFFALKYAVIGGEKLKISTAELWMKKFGVRILEGYGTTETAPVLSINTPMHYKEGTVGRLLPDIKYKLEPVEGIDEGGRLAVKGDNIMQGYMTVENAGVLQPLSDGWYDTGDIVKVDNEGFVTIQGRAKRFAKVGGEMVSLTAVEQVVAEIYPQSLLGILALFDDKKGEQLVLVCNNPEAKIEDVREYCKQKGLSELWIPKKVVFIKDIPVLGSGKFDYITVAKMLKEEN